MSDNPADLVNVRYMVDDVDAAVDFYTKHLGFTLRTSFAPAFADVVRGSLRLLLSGPKARQVDRFPDGTVPGTRWMEPHSPHRRTSLPRSNPASPAGLAFRNDIVAGPGGSAVLLEDPSGNVVELVPTRR